LNNIEISKLSNSITVVTEKIPQVKSFSLGFFFNVGSRDETPENNGISHFIEHMLFKGTRSRTAKKIAIEIESLGGYLNAFTTKEQTCFYGRGLEHRLPKTFEVLSDMILNSTFDEEEIKKEAKVIIDELNDIEDSPEELIFDVTESLLFKGNSLAMPIIGNKKNILRFNSDELKYYFKRHYGRANLIIAASGAVNHAELVKLTEKFFAKEFGFSESNRKNIFLNQPENRFVYKDIQQTHFIIAKPTYGLTHPKRKIVSLISHILGEGSSSRLFQKLREKNGIAYQVNTFLNSFEDISSFGVYFSTGNENAEQAQYLIFKEFGKMQNLKISLKELNRAKEYLIGNYLMSLENTTNKMYKLANNLIYYGRIKPVEESIEEIKKITLDDIAEVSGNLLEKTTFSSVMISSKNLIIHSAA